MLKICEKCQNYNNNPIHKDFIIKKCKYHNNTHITANILKQYNFQKVNNNTIDNESVYVKYFNVYNKKDGIFVSEDKKTIAIFLEYIFDCIYYVLINNEKKYIFYSESSDS